MITQQKFIGIGQRPGVAITGTLAVAAIIGQAVAFKDNGLAENAAGNEVELATGRRGFFLTRNVVAADADLTLKQAALGVQAEGTFKSPVQIPGHVTAVMYDQVIVEGDDLVDPTITNAAAEGTPVAFSGGKFVLAEVLAGEDDEGKYVVGWISQHYPPEDDTDDRTRVRIDMA